MTPFGARKMLGCIPRGMLGMLLPAIAIGALVLLLGTPRNIAKIMASYRVAALVLFYGPLFAYAQNYRSWMDEHRPVPKREGLLRLGTSILWAAGWGAVSAILLPTTGLALRAILKQSDPEAVPFSMIGVIKGIPAGVLCGVIAFGVGLLMAQGVEATKKRGG